MRHAFPFPLPAAALDEFRHPADWHGLHRVLRHEREVLVGNGYVAVRCTKGAWIDSDFPPASAEVLGRFGKLPWARFGKLTGTWRDLDAQRGRIFHHGRLGLWLKGRLAPTPVWRINERLVRLSILQLVAMLPRVELFTGMQDLSEPVFFRFSGGQGIIALDKKLTIASAELFPPARDMWTGERLPERRGPKPSFALPGWPPVDLSET
jgi:hypothetical protein